MRRGTLERRLPDPGRATVDAAAGGTHIVGRMGNFYTNVTVFGARHRECADVLRELGREGYVVEQQDCSVVYDRGCEQQDTEILAALAEHLATHLDGVAFAVLNHDDDLLWFQLYRGSDLVAEYANSGGPPTRVRALCETLARPGAAFAVWLLLKRPFIFQLSRHARLARRLGLPDASIGFGFQYLFQGERPCGIGEEQLIHVSAGG